MRLTAVLLLVAGSMMLNKAAFAQQSLSADDVKWINQCIVDNKGGASSPIVRHYCFCMNEKMDNNEAKSISVWEKTHAKERAECDKDSGWK